VADPTTERVAEFKVDAFLEDYHGMNQEAVRNRKAIRAGMKKALPIITALLAQHNGARARVEELEVGLKQINVAHENLFAMVNGEVPALLRDHHQWDKSKSAIELAHRLARGEDCE